MTWFKVDDNLAHHRKVLAAGNAAMGLWVRAGALCASQLTDGKVSPEMLRSVGTTAQARRLVDAGLWREVDEGYEFHEWSERQPSKQSVKEERAKTAERQRNWRERNAKRNGVSNALRNGVTNGAPSRPDPTRPPLLLTSSPDAPPQDTAEDEKKLSKNAALAQRILGCPPDDPRLQHVDQLISTHEPISRRAWLTTVIDNGDFDQLIEQAANPPADDNPWSWVPKDTGGDDA